MELTFLGTGGAWGLPELNCECLICREMRHRGERRQRPAFLLSGRTTLLLDCGPDICSQLSRNRIGHIDGVLISHEHGDHYLGLDELFSFKRTAPRERFSPIPVYLTSRSLEVVGQRFSYLQDMGVLKFQVVEPGQWVRQAEYHILPFSTNHGTFAKGSAGFLIRTHSRHGRELRIAYTSDFFDIPHIPRELTSPDYLILQSYWLNEPARNRAHHMSFQRAMDYLSLLKPRKESFLVHIGGGDTITGDPANNTPKKSAPHEPLSPPQGGEPYPVPLHQEQWQETVKRVLADRELPYEVTVAYDDMCIQL